MGVYLSAPLKPLEHVCNEDVTRVGGWVRIYVREIHTFGYLL